MFRFRRWAISLVSAVIACSIVYAVYIVQLRQVQLQETIQIVVPAQYIEAGAIVSKDMLEVDTVIAASVAKDVVIRADSVIGMQAMIPLGEGEPIREWKLVHDWLLPGRDQAIFELPRDYVLSIANGIRAGDRVQIYASGNNGSRRLLMEDVGVASVKLSGNDRDEQLVTASAGNSSQRNKTLLLASRTGAQVEKINVVLTEQQWLQLDQECGSKGAKLVIAFTSEKIGGDEE